MRGCVSESADSVQVTWFDLDPSDDTYAELEETLTIEDQRKVVRHAFGLERKRAVVGMARRREAMSRFCDIAPGKISFEYRTGGQPYARCEGLNIDMSVSRSGNLGVIAISSDGAVGVDVEVESELPSWQDFSHWAATDVEAQHLLMAANTDRTLSCLRIWTRKEAFLKATGDGIGRGLKHVSVPLNEGVWGLPFTPVAGGPSWLFFELTCPQPGFGAALVVRNGTACDKNPGVPGVAYIGEALAGSFVQ